MRALLLAMLFVLGAATAWAVEPNERLADPALEARARTLSKGLRCPVCQNESIDESQADLAHDIRVLLRERLLAGDTDRQAMQFLVARYGDFVLLEPRMTPATWLLWFGPPAVLAVAGLGVVLAMRRRGGAAPPLSEEERKRLAALLENER
jgi:cytochrome c-type biogenesis protein CcmH